MTDEEEFYAWLDGELHGDEAARVEARVAASPELTAQAIKHRRLATNLRDAFSPVMEGSAMPPSFQLSDVIDFGARAREREARRSWFGVPQWAAMAATLALGLVVGNMAGGGGPSSPVAVDGSHLVAAASLDQALDSRLASAPAGEGPRIGLTFRDASGRICRSFLDGPASGLACRDGDSWQIRGLFQAGEGQSADYRMAAGQDPRLASLIGETIAGEPFDAAQEKTALDKGWR